MADDQCNHAWYLTEPKETAFRRNSQMWSGERAHATCAECGARTWLSREEWEALPTDSVDYVLAESKPES